MGRFRTWALGLAAGLVAGAAAAQAPVVIDEPEWARLPGTGDLERFYPKGARSASLPGLAVLECVAADNGTWKSCKVVEEAPIGFGFGQATLKVADKFRLKPTSAGGKSIDGAVVRIPLRWTIGGGADRPDTYYRVVEWASAPTPQEVEAVRPAGVTGTAYLDCVLYDLRLTSCSVLEETTENAGLGAAARKLAASFKAVRPLPSKGGRLVLPVRFGAESSGALDSTHLFAAAPSPEALAAAFPAPAREAGVDQGLVQLACTIAAGGVPTACRVAEETPQDLGFGAAALGLAGQMRLNPWTADGRAVIGTELRLPIRFVAAKPAG